MTTYSGKNDKESGVRVKHIYSDNHNLNGVKKFKGNSLGSVNYKMHFKSCGDFDVSNTLRPENLTLESYFPNQPYTVMHKARIHLEYSPQLIINEEDGDFLDGTLPYTFRLIPDNQYKGFFLVERGLNFDQYFGDELEINKHLMREDRKFFDVKLVNDSKGVVDDEIVFLRFNKPISYETLYYFDLDTLSWRPTNAYFSIEDYMVNSKFRFYYPTSNTHIFDLNTKYSLDPYGYDEVTLLEIIDKSPYDFYTLHTDESSDLWNSALSFDYNFKYATNVRDITYYGLGNQPVTGIIGMAIKVKSINNVESDDNNLIEETVDIIKRFEIFSSDKLTTGISFNFIQNDITTHVYLPFKTNINLKSEYINDSCELMDYRFFTFDFDAINLIVIKDYTDRVEFISPNNLEILDYQVANVKEID